MRVRYFPQTHVPADVADVLMRLFDEVAVTVASDDDPVPEGLTAIGPTPDEMERLRGLLAGWRQFSGVHGEGVSTYALGLERRADPLDDQLTSEIKSELMRQVKGAPEREAGADSLTAARALLSLAVEYDRRNRELDDELARLDRRQAGLLDTLKGELQDLPEVSPVATSTADLQMHKRLTAWATLFVAEGQAEPDRVFVTTSREALDLVEEFVLPLEDLGVFSVGSLSDECLGNLLSGGAFEKGAGGGDEPVMVRIFIARREHPYKLFNGFIQAEGVYDESGLPQDADISGNVLFLLLGGDAPD